MKIANINNEARQAKGLFHLLGIGIAKFPDQVKALLALYDMELEGINGKGIFDAVVKAIDNEGEAFHQDLALLLYKINKGPDPQEDAFNLPGMGGEAGGGITVGADPVSAIAGAIGSVANLFGNKQKQQLMQSQTRSQALQTMLAYRAQQEQQVVAKQAALRKQANQQRMLKTGGAVVVLALAGWFVVKSMPKGNPAAVVTQ